MHTLRRQAGVRLLLVMGLLAVGIMIVGLNSYQERRAREVQQKQVSLRAYYQATLPRVETDWQRQAQQTRARIEFLRLLESTSDTRWAQLTTFLNAQGEFSDFAALLVVSPQGDILYRYGPDAQAVTTVGPMVSAGWHADVARRELFRVLATPLWLGAQGQGQLVLLRSLSNSALSALAVPEVSLIAMVNGAGLSASHPDAIARMDQGGLAAGLVNANSQPPVIQLNVVWPGTTNAAESGAGPSPTLVVQSEFRDSFPLAEFLLRPVAAIVMTLALILLGLGGWLRRTVGRIESITAAAHEYKLSGDTALAERAMPLLRARPDEIQGVGVALLELMRSVDQRDQEQRNYLETLALLDEAVLELDCNGVIRHASAGWQRLTRRGEDATGHALAEYVHFDDAEVVHALCDAFGRGDKQQGHIRVRLRSEHAGQDQWIECRFVTRQDEAGVVVGSRGIMRDVTQNYAYEKQISHMALHDALTDLPNRVLLEDRIKVALRMARRSGQRVAVCFIDLDHFKNVNDSLGHTAGDQLLKAFARQVKMQMREGDTLSRWGGDEFVLLLPEMGGASDVREVLNKILEGFKGPLQLEDTDLVLTFSVGAALFPDDAQDIELLLSQADRALFYAKTQGRNQACLFGEISVKGDGRTELYLQQKLAEAVTNQRIEAWFQPVVDAHTGQCVGAEVLARWHDPTHGWVSPATFIPMAESLGLIRDLGQQIWLQALDAVQAWRAEGHALTVAVNVSKRQFFSHDLVELLLAQLSQRGLKPQDVVLEITESVATQDAAKTAEQLNALDQAGFGLAVDDFGTGYSSLSQLHELPADELKIDISFVRRIHEPAGRSMVHAIVQFAKALNLKTVAEGVEDAATAQALRELGADCLQGYFFAKPMPRADFARWITSHPHGVS